MTDVTNDWTARDDWTRDDLTFGELYRSIVKCDDKFRVATTEDLMRRRARGSAAAQQRHLRR